MASEWGQRIIVFDHLSGWFTSYPLRAAPMGVESLPTMEQVYGQMDEAIATARADEDRNVAMYAGRTWTLPALLQAQTDYVVVANVTVAQ